jgi:phospholipid transport system substrate-binding protein
MTFMKRLLAASLLLLLGSFCGASPAASSPQDLVRQTSDRMIDALQKNRAQLRSNPAQVYDLVNEIVLPHFDFTVMSRWVLGPYWRQASPEQRQRFTDEFRTLMVRTYSQALLEYSNEKIEFLPTPPLKADATDAVVRSEFHPNTGAPIPVNYSLHRMGSGWKIYDVSVDGVSLVTNYRSTFADQIRTQGMDATIDHLARRNRQTVTP